MNIELRNKLVEFYLLPYFVVNTKYYTDLQGLELDYEDDRKLICEKIKKIEEDIKKYCVFSEDENLLVYVYVKAIKKGKNIESLEEFYDYALSLEEDEILEIFSMMSPNKSKTKEDLVKELENMAINGETKWNRTLAVLYPKKIVEESIKIFKYVEEFYTPIYEKYRKDREAYEKEFDFEKTLDFTTLISLDLKEDIKNVRKEKFGPIILSPLFISMYYFKIKGVVIFAVSCKIENHLRKEEDSFDEQYFPILKLLGDESRYAVLKLLAKNEYRVKEIAEKLGITSAAVSFHIKKLSEERILTIGKDRSVVKYEVNKNRIGKIIEKLQKDFLEK